MKEDTRRERSIISIIQKLRSLRKEPEKVESPLGVFERCGGCADLIPRQKIQEQCYTCPKCHYHFNISARDRIDMLLDKYEIINSAGKFIDPISFPGYEQKYKENMKKSGLKEGLLVVEGYLKDIKMVVASLDNRFFMGSMGSYIGEEITRAFEYAGKNALPILIFSTSGGARMQEGIFSLMQMAKTSIAVENYGRTKNLYISYMTNPTTGGVTASFASLGDIILAEPGALIGFAGARVIRETIKGELPENFQRAEFLRARGFLDEIVHRKDMKEYIYRLLRFHGYGSCQR